MMKHAARICPILIAPCLLWLVASCAGLDDDSDGGGDEASLLSQEAALTPYGCTATVASGDWTGEYWNNTEFVGAPVMTRNDGSDGGGFYFGWGDGGPSDGCGIAHDNFSARWTRMAYFSSGTYRFSATADDGVRLYIDGWRFIDRWTDQAPTTYTVDVYLGAGNHTLTMEYYERGGGAMAALTWDAIMNGNTPGGANLALNAGCAADSIYSAGWECYRARDGIIDPQHKWASSANTLTHWLVYDLGSYRTVNGYIVYHAGAGGEPWYFNTQEFRIQIAASANGPWTDETIVNNPGQSNVSIRSYYSPRVLRFIRLYITRPGIDYYARIPEFQVIGQ